MTDQATTVGDILDALPPVSQPGIGHNVGDAFAQMRERVTELCDGCDRAVKTIPTVQMDVEIDKKRKLSMKLAVPVFPDRETCDRGEGFLNQVTSEYKAAEAARKEANRPHDEAIDANNARFSPLTDRLTIVGAIFRAAIAMFLKKEQDRIETERRAAAAAAAEKARAAAQAERRAQANPTVENVVAAQQAGDAAAAAVERRDDAMEARPQARSEYSTRARTLREVRRAEVVDIDECYKFYRTHADVLDCLTKLASADARKKDGPAVIPGCKIISEQSLS